MQIKNLLMKSNERHYKALQKGEYKCKVPSGTCTIYKRYEGEKREVWVVSPDPDFEEEVVDEVDLIDDQCVFKKPLEA